MIAAIRGHTEVIKLLLEHSPDPNTGDKDGNTALMFATQSGEAGIIELLLAHGADIALVNKRNGTALVFAVAKPRPQIAQLLLEHGATLPRELAAEVLQAVLQWNNLEVARLLFARGADANSVLPSGDTLLMNAVESDNREVTGLLLEHGAKVNARTRDGRLPVKTAVDKGYHGIVKLLLEHGADVNTRDDEGRTLIMAAANKGKVALAQLLVEYEADLRITSKNGWTVLEIAEAAQSSEVSRVLRESGAISEKVYTETKKLVEAVIGGEIKAAQSALKRGADVNAKHVYGGGSGKPVLIIAAALGHTKMTRLLLDHDAAVDIKDSIVYRESFSKSLQKLAFGIADRVKGNPALIFAALYGHAEIVELLLERGADVNAKNDMENTALSYASEYGRHAVVKTLLEHGADVNGRYFLSITALMEAAENGQLEVVKLLLEHGADVELKIEASGSRHGWTALQIAEAEGHTEIANLLKKAGAKQSEEK